MLRAAAQRPTGKKCSAPTACERSGATSLQTNILAGRPSVVPARASVGTCRSPRDATAVQLTVTSGLVSSVIGDGDLPPPGALKGQVSRVLANTAFPMG